MPSVNPVRCSWTRSSIASSRSRIAGGPGQWDASASAVASWYARRARSNVRRASETTTHEPSGRSSAGTGISSNSSGASASCPSACRPSAIRSSPSRNRSRCLGARARARAATASSGTSSRTGGTSTRTTGPVDSWEDGTNSRSDSISSPQYSRRTGRREVPGNTSSTPPRTANSPRCSTTSVRAYPSPTNRSASASGGSSIPLTSSTGGISPRVGTRPCIAASAGVTRTNGPFAARSRRTASARRAETSGEGLIPS